MSDSNGIRDRIGFSTGALDRGDYRAALNWLNNEHVTNVELSALRVEELAPLVDDLEQLPLDGFEYLSFHAPSAFPARMETEVIGLLNKVAERGWNIVVHPDVIREPRLWRCLGPQLLIENMDRRKHVGRTARELATIFKELPQARLCLDVAHARQLDTTLNILAEIVKNFSSRIAEIHISELDSRCQHQPMSSAAVCDYQEFAKLFHPDLPVIIESMLDGAKASLRMDELDLAHTALTPHSKANHASNEPVRP